jgi:hypothetical protein
MARTKLLYIKKDAKRKVLVRHRVSEALIDLIGTYLSPVRLTDNVIA